MDDPSNQANTIDERLVGHIAWHYVTTVSLVSFPGGPGPDEDSYVERFGMQLEGHAETHDAKTATRGYWLRKSGQFFGYLRHAGMISFPYGNTGCLPVIAVKDLESAKQRAYALGAMDAKMDFLRCTMVPVGGPTEFIQTASRHHVALCQVERGSPFSERADLSHHTWWDTLVSDDLDRDVEFYRKVAGWDAVLTRDKSSFVFEYQGEPVASIRQACAPPDNHIGWCVSLPESGGREWDATTDVATRQNSSEYIKPLATGMDGPPKPKQSAKPSLPATAQVNQTKQETTPQAPALRKRTFWQGLWKLMFD